MNELEVFTAALELTDSAARESYLEEACSGCPEVRVRLDALLRNASQPLGLLEASLDQMHAALDELLPERTGTQIGPYKLLQQIGEGGMGVVYMAEQSQPVQRKVALKLIKAGMDSRQIIARFEAERQALALMDHVNIARVLDAGATESGRPYFVMELVNGVPITKYCDDNRLTPRQRLELFVPVCQAIQHAHQKGIIHRDIKPSNVIVTLYDGKPVPKVIDFGVAKATEQKLTERTLFTQYGTMVGTLEYMSPEQAEMSALGVDTRSDIYSLGVLLYELLTGSTPLSRKQMKEAAFAEILRLIKEEEPPKPSTRLSGSGEALASISAQRHTEPAKLSKLMRGELDWIVMKTLEKDRNSRYETASAFAADVQRYLSDEPVHACPPSAGYRLRKFLRRHKNGVLTAGLLSCFLTAVAIVGVAIYVRYVNDQSETAQAVQEFLAGAKTAIEAGDLALAGRRVAEARGRIGNRRSSRSETAVAIDNLAAELDARQNDREKFENFVRLTSNAHDVLGRSANNGGTLLAEEALQVFEIIDNRRWLERLNQRYLTPEQKRQVTETAYETLVALADCRTRWNYKMGNDPQVYRRSLELLDQARAFHEPTRAFWFVRRQAHFWLKDDAAFKEDDQRFQAAKSKNAWDYYLPGHSAGWDGNLDEAIRSYQAALRVQPNHYNSLFFLANRLASDEINRRPESIAYSSACIALRPHSLGAYFDRARCYEKLGLPDESEADFAAAIAAAKNVDDRYFAHTWRLDFYQRRGRTEKAQEDMRQMIGLIESKVKSADLGPNDALRVNNLAWRLATSPDPKCRDARRALQFATKANQLAPADGGSCNTLGVAHYRAENWRAAIAALEKSSELRPGGGNSSDWYFLAMAHWQLGEKQKGRAWYDRAVEWMEKNSSADEELCRFRAEAAELLCIKVMSNSETSPSPKPDGG